MATQGQLFPELCRREPGAKSKVLFGYLKWLFDRFGQVFPGMERLTDRYKVCRKTIQRWLNELEQAGWISRRRRVGTSSEYVIHETNVPTDVPRNVPTPPYSPTELKPERAAVQHREQPKQRAARQTVASQVSEPEAERITAYIREVFPDLDQAFGTRLISTARKVVPNCAIDWIEKGLAAVWNKKHRYQESPGLFLITLPQWLSVNRPEGEPYA